MCRNWCAAVYSFVPNRVLIWQLLTIIRVMYNIQLIMQDLLTAALYLTVKLWNPTSLIQTFGWNHHVMGLRSNNRDKREKQQLPLLRTDRFCRRSTVLRIAWWFLLLTLAQFAKLTYINEYNHLVRLLSWVTLSCWRDYKWPTAALGHGRHKKPTSLKFYWIVAKCIHS